MDELEQLLGEGERVDGDTAAALAGGAGGAGAVYFGCRLCPFAHRAWWAMEELGYKAKYIHIDLGSRKPAWYAKSINPFGTVPCLYVGGKGVFESLIVVEYINDVQHGSLVPADAYDRTSVRLLVARFDDTVRGSFYNLLTNQSKEKDAELRETLTSKLEAFERLYAERKLASGPFLLGAQLSLTEIAIFPFIERMQHVLAHYRGYHLFAGNRLPTLHAAYTAVQQRPAFQKTTAPAEYFIKAYKGYAAGTPRGPLPTTGGNKLSFSAAVAIAVAPVVLTAIAGANKL